MQGKCVWNIVSLIHLNERENMNLCLKLFIVKQLNNFFKKIVIKMKQLYQVTFECKQHKTQMTNIQITDYDPLIRKY